MSVYHMGHTELSHGDAMIDYDARENRRSPRALSSARAGRKTHGGRGNVNWRKRRLL
jgi:hypothetical protein